MRDALNAGDGDVQAVLIIRHAAIPMAFNDAMWAKYEIGKTRSIKDGDDWATRNPFLNSRRATTGDRPTATLSWFASHGHILLGCGRGGAGTGQSARQRAQARLQDGVRGDEGQPRPGDDPTAERRVRHNPGTGSGMRVLQIKLTAIGYRLSAIGC